MSGPVSMFLEWCAGEAQANKYNDCATSARVYFESFQVARQAPPLERFYCWLCVAAAYQLSIQ
jgi:hypothetical protein